MAILAKHILPQSTHTRNQTAAPLVELFVP
jgi:hypothetical protein